VVPGDPDLACSVAAGPGLLDGGTGQEIEMPTRYPESKDIASFGDMRRYYDSIRKELEQAESSIKAERWGHKKAVKGKRETAEELKKSKGTTAKLQKQVGAQERAKEDSNRAAAWSKCGYSGDHFLSDLPKHGPVAGGLSVGRRVDA